MKIYKILITSFLILMFNGCTDIYEYELSRFDNRLVIQGLITDQPGPYLVKLTRSSTFGQAFPRIVEKDAILQIVCNEGQGINLVELQPGHYYTPDEFIGIPGKSYTLYIQTSDGKTYQSNEQLLMPPVDVVSVAIEPGQKTFSQKSGIGNQIYQYNVEVGNILLGVKGEGFRPRLRFDNFLLVDYLKTLGMFDYSHCWIIRPLSDYMDSQTAQNITENISQYHLAGSIPVYQIHYPFLGFTDYFSNLYPSLSYGSFKILMTNLYSINEDTFLFYDFMEKQLSDQGRFFDPVAAQLPGNMKCTSDPDEPVFGLFEASSHTWFPVSAYMHTTEMTVTSVHLVDTLPQTGCVFNAMPQFLIDL